MARYLLIDAQSGVVENAVEAEAGVQIPGKALVRSDIGEPGWLYVNGSILPPSLSLDQRKAEMQDAVRAKRWEVETGGIMFAGAPIGTDDKSQAKITGGSALFDKDPTIEVIDFEAKPTVWVTVDRDTMTAIGIAVGRHVQGCFSYSRQLCEAINAAADAAALAAIDINSGWPG